MSFSFGPDVVKDNLVLYLDAANPRSYVSGSSSWTDLTLQGFTSIISGPVTSSTEAGGALSYNSPGWVYIPTKPIFATLTNNFTILGWIKKTNTFDGARLFGLGYVSQWQFECRGLGNGTRLSINYNNGGGNIFSSLGPIITLNEWQHVGFVINNSNVNFIYNGQISPLGAFTVSGDFSISGQPYSIGNYNGGTDGAYAGLIASHMVYNRVLSQAEILQNYNSTKGRFGLT